MVSVPTKEFDYYSNVVNVADNKLETLRRWPSDLRRYIKWSAATKQEYGGIINYVRDVRLKWQPVSSSSTTGAIFDYKSPIPFEDPRDYKMLPNDWPYGLERGISHLVVWLKNRLEVVPPLGDLSESSRKLVQDFIQKEFVEPTDALAGSTDNVLWFKNWVSLQSVPGIDHVHVLVRNVPQKFVDEKWIKGERPVQDMSVVDRIATDHP